MLVNNHEIKVQPDLATLQTIIENDTQGSNVFPVYSFLPALNLNLTPHQAYLKLSKGANKQSFLLESAKSYNELDRYSFIGINPTKIITNNNSQDPLTILKDYLKDFKLSSDIPSLPPLSGGAIGYVSYDCIKYFEPKVNSNGQYDKMKDTLQLPESLFMISNTIVAFDHVFQRFQIIHNICTSSTTTDLKGQFDEAQSIIKNIISILITKDEIDSNNYPFQKKIKLNQTFTSNVGQEGYENFVSSLKQNIKKGDIIQAVPSQRISRPTSLHPFNIYKHLRMVNPSPYLFYIDCLDFQIIGASPELLCKSDSKNKLITHPIAGTVKRGSTLKEDDELADQLRSSLKDKAEHIMLVDLARNDINRVCNPRTTSVDKLLTIQKFSHVQHLVSEVSGTLRHDKDRFDAFRSIFPAGTVSGAPKIKAMQLISGLENEKRGVYAGAVGHWSYDGKSMDTCIALRTMVYKDDTVYLQAGGGIVFDSDENDEYIETMNKMMANNKTILDAEEFWAKKVGTTTD
ncbi:hypothetical protein TBLA_0A07670 [Henningerozyma blattae CBS 6284]|uniref:anthranilate synthase n=1 Tax=Henningerozyma blattae (strain ATCC 34711 / CBS 6284 / DSM 70876 / NBRC 10599 / NRRL Y-10934 / UCD 77-7) TaxID=1071380 RepID=I2GWQ4_HENB6|nr:hypothetical protein TBLA_0A07670 [Tetrapisispora blattae CBS 6284]CCH58556.1 hypothetical protein TBLA_0A07670 [Tetrapisispora blattae CBS 6284]